MALATSTPRSPTPALALLALACTAAAAVGPYWLPGTSLLLSDLIAYFPSLFASLPATWDPMVQGGTPLLPNPQAGWFYPPAWLLRGDLQAGLPWFLFTHLLVIGVATWAWARTRFGDGLEALTAGIVAIGAGATVSLFLTPDKLPGHVALPVLLLGLHWMLGEDRPGRRALGWLLGCGAVAATWFAGSVEAIFIAGIAAPAWAFGLPGALGSPLRRVGASVAVLALGTALAACLLVPFFTLLPETARSGALSMEEALQLSTHPVDWLGWLAPNPFWSGEELRYTIDADGTTRGRWLRTLYGGALTLPLIAAALTRRRPGTVLALVGFLGFVFLALGDLNPLRSLIHALPGIGSMRYPDKWFMATVPFQAWLVAAGMAAVREDRRAARMALVAAVVLSAVGALGALVGGAGPLGRASSALALVPLAIGAGVLFGAQAGRRWLVVLPLVIAVDLVVAGAAAFPRADADAARAVPAGVAAIRADWLRRADGAQAGPPRIWDETQHQTGQLPAAPPGEELRRAQREVLSPNTAVEHGLAYIDGMRAIRMKRQALFSAILEDLPPVARRRLLRAVGNDYWVTYSGGEALQLAGAAPLRPVAAAPGVPLAIGLLAEPDPLPRLRLVGAQTTFPDDAAAYRFMQARPRADVIALIAGDPQVDSLRAAGAAGALRWTTSGPGRWEAAWESKNDGILVLQESWAPGWSWSLDGGDWQPAARVEHVLVGAPAPAGAHSIVLAYRPDGLPLGVALSLFALCAALGVARGLARAGATPQGEPGGELTGG